MPQMTDSTMTGREYWRSVNELADTDEFREFMYREFPAGASEMLDSGDRRHFLKIMGASMAFAGMGLAGCRRWPEEHIVPYARRPEGRIPGKPLHYATSMELGGVAQSLLATSFDGRPIKIEGNPDHPASQGAASLHAQASVLNLYDPDRSREVQHKNVPSDWASFTGWAGTHFGGLATAQGKGLAVLSEATSSPSVLAMKANFLKKYPQAKWHEYEPFNHQNEQEGATLAFGKSYRTHYAFDQAKVIVSFDGDFLGHHPNAIRHIRNFASGRKADDSGKTMNRLYVFEGGFSLTGSNADHRVALRPSAIPASVAWLAGRVLGENTLTAEAEQALDAGAIEHLEHAFEDLNHDHGSGVVVAGPSQPAEVHALVHLINESLGNAGKTVTYTADENTASLPSSISELSDNIRAARVDTLLILGGNPAFNAPEELKFAELLKQVAHAIHLSDYVDETSILCEWHLNRAHYLESWGDGRSWDGTITICQPLIEPLFGGKTPLEVLALLSGDAVPNGQEIVKATHKNLQGGGKESRWRKAVHDGFIPGSSATLISSKVGNRSGNILSKVRPLLKSTSGGWEVVFASDGKIHDGRFANNGWLQELPDSLGKLTWDNAVLMSPGDADQLGVQQGDMVTLTAGDRVAEGPVLLIPGLPAKTVQVALGYGRKFEGRICTGSGFNFYPIRTSDEMWSLSGINIVKTGKHYELACTQDHWAMDTEQVAGKGIQSRLPGIFREANLDEYKHHPKFASHRVHTLHRLSLWDDQKNYEGANYKWALSIDLTSCVGCSACVVACQAENNIPIVGKDQVSRGREMHWIRIDRYYKFGKTGDKSWDADQLESIAYQPVTCMHCENAPCEEVCPVAATVHDQDGLNVMVYNRCVGTRYCSNNCPYKVRRFNYFDFHRRKPHREQPGTLLQVEPGYYTRSQAAAHKLHQLQFNPEVTIRVRGVMEKCSYCIQRISEARIEAKNAWTKLPEAEKQQTKRIAIEDGTITPACAQTCPAEAIVFGDLFDPDSRVAKLHNHDRSYEMLEELNNKTRTRYLAKLRNPRPESGATANGHMNSSEEAASH